MEKLLALVRDRLLPASARDAILRRLARLKRRREVAERMIEDVVREGMVVDITDAERELDAIVLSAYLMHPFERHQLEDEPEFWEVRETVRVLLSLVERERNDNA